MKTIRAAVYCRVSSNKRIQMHGVEAQQEYYIDYFKRNPQCTLFEAVAQQESVNKSNHIK